MSASAFFFLKVSIAILVAASLWVWRRKLWGRYRTLLESLQTLLAMSAKLSCSARHISGFSDTSIQQDLINYSPLFALVRVHHEGQKTFASLFSCIKACAHFLPSRGAQLECPDTVPLNVDAESIPPEKFRIQICARNLEQPLQAQLAALINEDNRQGYDTRALLVMRGKQVVAAAYGSGITPQTRLLGWSMSKSLLAMLWGRMETLGLADVHLCRLFPEWDDDGRSTITLKHLLQMCDGLAFDETYRTGTDATRMLFCGGAPNKVRYAPSQYALRRPLIHSPGMHFSYSSGTTNLLARWMHKRLGGTEAAERFLQREFLAPLGMQRTFFEMDSEGVFVGSSYAYASAEDWGKLGALMLSDGIANGQRILDSDWISQATEPNTSVNDRRYGYQFWLNTDDTMPPLYPDLPTDSYFMLGNREQKLMISPSHDATIVRLGWSSRPYPAELRFGEILAQLPRD